MIGTIFQAHYWTQSVGPNVAAVLPCGILGWLWSRTKFWPLGLLHTKMERVEKSLEALHESHQEIHRKLDDLAR